MRRSMFFLVLFIATIYLHISVCFVDYFFENPYVNFFFSFFRFRSSIHFLIRRAAEMTTSILPVTFLYVEPM